MLSLRRFSDLVIFAAIFTFTGCTIHPAGESQERAAATRFGTPFEKEVQARDLPALAADPTPEELVNYAFLCSADLEQRYWTWKSAIEQIPQDGTQPASLNFAAGTAINKGRASWANTTVTLSNDPMSDIKWPGKMDASAKQALENAKAAGRRFIRARYDLRNKVLAAYYDYALVAELLRLELRNEQLFKITAETTESRNRAGATDQQQVLKADNELDLSRNAIENLQAQLRSRLASINALLNRTADAPLPVPTALPASRVLAYDDMQLVDLAAKQNPELVALADEVRGRREGLRLAQMQYIPDFNFSAGTDVEGMVQSIVGQATIPLFRFEALNAAIAQAEANLRDSQALHRQTGSDLTAQVIMDITSIRDAKRQIDLFDKTILPRARQAVTLARSSYENGHASLLEILDAQRSLIDLQRLVANLTIARQKQIFELEAITTVNLSFDQMPGWNTKARTGFEPTASINDTPSHGSSRHGA